MRSNRPYVQIDPDMLEQARQIDLLSYLRAYEPSNLVKVKGTTNVYCTAEHDSLKISNGKWYWWSRGFGGYSALDYLMIVKEYGFVEAVETLTGQTMADWKPPPPAVKKDEPKVLLLPPKNKNCDRVAEYLFGRGIDYQLIQECIAAGIIFESADYHKRDSKDIWVNKLRCSCGSSFRKDKWHTKLDGKISYGYQCYNQINNGNKKKREALGLDTEGYCDIRMITDWKLDFMAKELLEHLWQDRKASVLIAVDLIKRYYKDERLSENQHDAVSIKAKIDKAQTRLTNLIAMRADGELSKEEYQTMRKPIDAEIQQLQERLNQAPNDEQPKNGLELDGIISTLNTLIDFSGTKISEEVINQFIYRVTPTSNTTFDWYVNLNGTADVRATFTAEGRKNRAVIKLEEIEQISSLHRKENEDNGMFLKNPLVFTFLRRLPSSPNNQRLIFCRRAM